MKIERKLLSRNIFSRPGTKLSQAKGIVIHYTGVDGQNADQVCRYFEALGNQIVNEENTTPSDPPVFAGAHFVIGLTGEKYQLIPLSEMTYHVGSKSYKPEALVRLSNYPNNCTIGIELCIADGGSFTDKTLTSAIELTAYLCKIMQLSPARDLYRHYDITGKNCPRPFVDNQDDWNRFKTAVQLYMNSPKSEIVNANL